MIDETYADGISGIQITGNVIRIDFASHDVVDGEGGQEGAKPPLVPRQRLIMTLDGFGHSFGMLERVMKRLVDDGVFQRASDGSSKPKGTGGGSPNF